MGSTREHHQSGDMTGMSYRIGGSDNLYNMAASDGTTEKRGKGSERLLRAAARRHYSSRERGHTTRNQVIKRHIVPRKVVDGPGTCQQLPHQPAWGGSSENAAAVEAFNHGF